MRDEGGENVMAGTSTKYDGGLKCEMEAMG